MARGLHDTRQWDNGRRCQDDPMIDLSTQIPVTLQSITMIQRLLNTVFQLNSFLLKERLSKHLHTTLPITVRGTTGERIVNKTIELSFHLTGHDRKKLVSKAQIHVAEGTRAGMILGIHASGKPEDDIAMRLGRTKLQP